MKKLILIVVILVIIAATGITWYFISKEGLIEFNTSDFGQSMVEKITGYETIQDCLPVTDLKKRIECYQTVVLNNPINMTFAEAYLLKNADNYPDLCGEIEDAVEKAYCRSAVAVVIDDPDYCFKEGQPIATQCLIIYASVKKDPGICDLLDDRHGEKFKDEQCRNLIK